MNYSTAAAQKIAAKSNNNNGTQTAATKGKNFNWFSTRYAIDITVDFVIVGGIALIFFNLFAAMRKCSYLGNTANNCNYK